MASSRPIDSKREEFRKYLERAGVMDSLTKVLISLYEEQEKPSDALEYIRTHLAAGRPDSNRVISLSTCIRYIRTHLAAGHPDSNNTEIDALKEENAKLKERLAQYEGGGSKSHTPVAVHSTSSQK